MDNFFTQATVTDKMIFNTPHTFEEYVSNENSISQWDLYHWNRSIFERHMIPAYVYIWILLLVGIPGNALVCYVYHFKIRNKQLSSNIFILALSWFDLINCALTLPFELIVIFNVVQFDHPMFCKFARLTTFFCNNSTSVILLAIAIDRLRVFLSGPRRLQLKAFTSKAVVFVAILISGFISWPMLLFFGTYTVRFPNGVEGQMCLISNYYKRNNEPVEAFSVTLLVVHLLFDIAFIILYSVIGKRICYDTNVTRKMSASSDRVHSLRVTLRKGSDSSAEDDVFVTSIDGGRQSSIKHQDSKHSSLKDLKNSTTKLINSTNSSLASLDIRPRSKSEPLRLSLIKRTDTFRNSVKLQFRRKRSNASSVNSEWRIFDRRPTASRTSLMLFLVTIAYMITFLPYCILVTLRTVDPAFYDKLSDTEKSVYQVSMRSYCIGSAINPIIYSFVNSSFRKKCREALNDIFCWMRNRK